MRCRLTEFGASSLDFEIQYHVYSNLYDEVFTARHDVSIALLRVFAREKIDWAWPTLATIMALADGWPTGIVPVSGVSDEAEPPAAPPRPPSATAGEIAPGS